MNAPDPVWINWALYLMFLSIIGIVLETETSRLSKEQRTDKS